MIRYLLFTVLCVSWHGQVAFTQEDEFDDQQSKLATQVGLILRRNCYRCHKGQGSESGYAFNVTDVASMIDDGMLVEGDHEDSEIYNAIFSGRMPPRNRTQLPRPTPEEVETIKQWILSGPTEIPGPAERPWIELKTQLQQIRSDLQDRRRENRLNMRYFTLTHLHNDRSADDEIMNVSRLALVKTLNSLSWRTRLVQPESINETNTTYAIDITQLGWSRDHWDALAQAYPYGLSYGALNDPELKEIDDDIEDIRGGDVTPISLRADWLIAVATKPPVYHQLMFDLHLPELIRRKRATEAQIRQHPHMAANPYRMTDLDLENFLGVNVQKNILAGDVWRSAFTQSGVSGQNRMIERHAMRSGGFYWKSYDFKSSNRTAILSEFPLGPAFEDNPFRDLAFSHDGGEIIFSLPNGLQGYMLVDERGNRIDSGPIEVVADSLKTSGNEQIVTGVSCIACHRVGMIESPTDEVRNYSGTVGEARRKVLQLYPSEEDFRKLTARDGRAFVSALRKATRRFVPDDQDITGLPEPIGEVSRQFHLEPMQIETVAAELNISVDQLRISLQADPKLRQLGLRVLLRDGGTIKRAAWESPATFPLMKQAARQFGFDPG